jgi:hypothetical protein
MNNLWNFLDKIMPQEKAEDSDDSIDAPAKKSPPLQEESKRESTNSYPSLTSI